MFISQANAGPSSALTEKFRKLMTPVAVPLISGGFASLMTVYGSIAAPLATPATRPTTYGGNTSAGPYRIHTRQRTSTTAPAAITGLRRPRRSDNAPSSGQPMIHPNGTVADRMTAAP